MNTYLGINHHRLGPPPNWRDYRKGLFGLRFDRQRYIKDVETYIRKQHIWGFHMDITDYDNLSCEIGEDSCAMVDQLRKVLQLAEKYARRYTTVASPEERSDRLAEREERWQEACENEGLEP